MGLKPGGQSTITPWTTNTDNWATLANQTVKPFEAIRVALNERLRAGAPMTTAHVATTAGAADAIYVSQTGHPIRVIFDAADKMESSRNSGKFRVDLGQPTADGVHMSGPLHEVGATAINALLLL